MANGIGIARGWQTAHARAGLFEGLRRDEIRERLWSTEYAPSDSSNVRSFAGDHLIRVLGQRGVPQLG